VCERELRTKEKTEQLPRGKEKGARNRERKKKGENQEKKRRNTVKLSPNLLRSERYESCNLLPPIIYDLGTKRLKKNHEGMPIIFTPVVKET
jgi:hypothetical protein